MKKQLILAAALAIGAMSIAGSASTAQAGKKHGWHGGFYGGHFYTPYYGHGYGYGKCHFYLKKAKWTGKRFWWRKYHRCINYYGY